MVNSCCAQWCSNTYLSGQSVHEFPKGDKRQNIRKQWVRFVQTKRANFDLKPTSTAILCGAHFADNCFSNLMEYKSGFAKKLNLTKDAVPTIQAERPVPVDTHAPGFGTKRKTPSRSPLTVTGRVDASSSSTSTVDLPTFASTQHSQSTKKPRRAPAKLAVARVSYNLSDYILKLHKSCMFGHLAPALDISPQYYSIDRLVVTRTPRPTRHLTLAKIM